MSITIIELHINTIQNVNQKKEKKESFEIINM